MITWTLLLSLIVGYFAILAIATLLAQPFRVRLVTLVDEMMEEGGWNKSERSMLEFMAESSSSSAVGLMVPFAALYGLAEAVLRGHEDPGPNLAKLEADPRHPKLVTYHIVSVAGSSPFAVAASIPVFLLAAIALALRGERHLSQALDAPIRRVSSSFQPC